MDLPGMSIADYYRRGAGIPSISSLMSLLPDRVVPITGAIHQRLPRGGLYSDLPDGADASGQAGQTFETSRFMTQFYVHDSILVEMPANQPVQANKRYRLIVGIPMPEPPANLMNSMMQSIINQISEDQDREIFRILETMAKPSVNDWSRFQDYQTNIDWAQMRIGPDTLESG